MHRVHNLPDVTSAAVAASATTPPAPSVSGSTAASTTSTTTPPAPSVAGSTAASTTSTPTTATAGAPSVPATSAASTTSTAIVYTHTVHHGGNRYFATAEMAEIFRAHAAEIVRHGETELVPLLHRSGVDLLLIGPMAKFAVVAIEVGHLKAR